MDRFHKFPSTPHLFWLGETPPRDDKVMTAGDAESFLDGPIIVEEKVDGANIGLSFSADGELRIQNRGQYLTADGRGQFRGISAWSGRLVNELFDNLGDNLFLFGEWCYAQHSLHYSNLPDWFIGFDVLDSNADVFWPVEQRNKLLERFQLSRVAEIVRGRMSRERLFELLNGRSAYGAPHVEGLYLRRESADLLERRAKIVRAEFTEGITEHWSRKPMTVNECRANYG